MELIADFFLAAGAIGAGIYCFVLSRRLRAFTDLEGGMGHAVAVLSAQVDDMQKALEVAQSSAGASSASLNQITDRADAVARRLELLVASLHDVQEPRIRADSSNSQAIFARHKSQEAAE